MNVVVLRTAALPFTALHRLCTTAIAGFLGCGLRFGRRLRFGGCRVRFGVGDSRGEWAVVGGGGGGEGSDRCGALDVA